MAQNYILLETIELTQTAASVTFNNLPTTGYTDLKVVGSFRGTTAQVYEITHLRFNGATTNLSSRSFEGNGAAASSFTNAHIYFSSGVGASATSNTYSSAEAYIPNYRSSVYKTVSIDNTGENNATTSYHQVTAGLWSSNDPITSIELAPTGNFVAGSTFSLYAIAATGTTPVTAPFATGGNIVANDGTYWYHAFLSSGTFTPLKALSCDYLVIAGGGSGARGSGAVGAGGGAGGLRASTANSLLANTAYSAVVGAGGAAIVSAFANGNSGSNSSFNSMTSTGGGYGVGGGTSGVNRQGGSGGSGGGSQGWDTNGSVAGGLGNTPSTSPSQGNNGGTYTNNTGTNRAGSGGGGAGGAGGNATNGNGGTGGAGLNTITGYGSFSGTTTATNTGVSGYFAGGGGGSGDSPTSDRAGGSGGGGTGGYYSPAARDGIANTGSGGGGVGDGSGTSSGGGGSGIVIIRYAMV
jgi:hypothetical protein